MRFNIKQLTLACTMALGAASAQANVQHLSEGIFSPEKGVICDKKAGFCADGTGISMSWTEKHLGAAAVHAFSKNIEGGKFDSTDFVFSNGHRCKVQEQKCYKEKFGTEVAPTMTKILFW